MDPEQIPAEGSDRFIITWAVTKFLDLMLTLQIPDFQMYVSSRKLRCLFLPVHLNIAAQKGVSRF